MTVIQKTNVTDYIKDPFFKKNTFLLESKLFEKKRKTILCYRCTQVYAID